MRSSLAWLLSHPTDSDTIVSFCGKGAMEVHISKVHTFLGRKYWQPTVMGFIVCGCFGLWWSPVVLSPTDNLMFWCI
jgi:hypothetical protein